MYSDPVVLTTWEDTPLFGSVSPTALQTLFLLRYSLNWLESVEHHTINFPPH